MGDEYINLVDRDVSPLFGRSSRPDRRKERDFFSVRLLPENRRESSNEKWNAVSFANSIPSLHTLTPT